MPGEVHQFLVAGCFRQVIRAPTDAAREIPDFHPHFPGKIAVDSPLQSVRHARRKADIKHVHIVRVAHGPKFHRGRINQGVRPGELQPVQAFAEGQHSRLSHQRQIDGIINGKLHGVPARKRHDINASRRLPCQQQNQNQ